MPWEILTEAEYPAVLGQLDTNLTGGNGKGQVPDSILNQQTFAPAAIQKVLDRYPTAASETDETNQARITRAAIYFCAALLAGPVIKIISQNVQTRDMAFTRQPYDPIKRKAELEQMAEEELATVLTPAEETPNRPVMFTVARGCRGR